MEHMKPETKKDSFYQEQFARMDDWVGVENQLKREDKRVWKKARTKHLRAEGKQELREMEQEIYCSLSDKELEQLMAENAMEFLFSQALQDGKENAAFLGFPVHIDD